MKTLQLIILSFTFIISGCASEPVIPPATDAAITEGAKQYMSCAANWIRQIDDGKSDALTIAKGSATVCTKEFNHYTHVITQGANEPVRRRVEIDTNNSKVELILLPLVLKLRSQNK